MRREQGFSLIEVLAATAVFALVSALSVGLLVGALRTEDQSGAVLSDLSAAHRIAALLREDVGQLAPRAVRTSEGLEDPRIFAADINGTQTVRAGVNGAREIMVLTRAGWANPGRLQPRSSLQRVAWVLEGDRLYRTVWAYPDAARGDAPRRQLLAEPVLDVELDALQDGVWISTARVLATSEGRVSPPDAIRLRYVLPGLGALEHVVLSPAAEPRS